MEALAVVDEVKHKLFEARSFYTGGIEAETGGPFWGGEEKEGGMVGGVGTGQSYLWGQVVAGAAKVEGGTVYRARRMADPERMEGQGAEN